MSLLQSHLRHAELAQRAAAMACCLFTIVSCSFDSAPRTVGRASAASESGSSADAAQSPDASTDAAVRDAAESQPDSAMDAGEMRSMVQTSPGSMKPSERERDAEAPRDASKPAQENMAGSSSPAPVDAGGPRDAGTMTMTTPPAEPEPEPHCKPGMYTGTFSGMIQLIGLSLSTVTGTVSTELRINPAGTYLEIRDAQVMGVDQDGNTLTCRLSANINCATDELEDGVLSSGVFHNVASNSDTAFTGTATAMYSADPHSVVGTFTVEATDFIALLTGRGTWNLLLGR